jgi:DNA-binding MarR family transcriptional regulator
VASKKNLQPKVASHQWELVLPRQLAGWVRPRSWLSVREGSTAAIRMGHQEKRITLLEILWQSDEALDQLARHLKPPGPYLVVRAALPAGAREQLEQRGLGYLDAQGHLHLTAPGLLIHLDDPPPHRERTARETETLGVHGVRAVQALLEEPGPISLTALSERTRLSKATTYVILHRLERAGLLRSTGAGPVKRRTVTDRGALLDWLVRQPAARRRESSLDAALYARAPEELWRSVTAALDRAQVRHALTGAAAASRFGVGPTSVPLSRIRIDPEVPLEAALTAIGAERTDRAPNLRLVRDTGEVGVIGSELNHEVRLAPRVRVYLDCLAERRGEDIARQFRETVLAY